MRLAKELGRDHELASFRTLLILLDDTNEDVRYAAAESIQARGDAQYDQELITCISRIPQENHWPVYRASRSYPTDRMVLFLLKCMREEIVFWQGKKVFDNTNCFYLAWSLHLLTKEIFNADLTIPTPKERNLTGYERFLAKAENLIDNHESTNRPIQK